MNKSKSPLVDHAQKELELTGMFDKDSNYQGETGKAVMELIKLFSKQNHSGMSASICLEIFNVVARFKNLAPITSDPDDWNDVSSLTVRKEKTWQCKRDSALFSKDGGKTYYSIDDPGRMIKKSKNHKIKQKS